MSANPDGKSNVLPDPTHAVEPDRDGTGVWQAAPQDPTPTVDIPPDPQVGDGGAEVGTGVWKAGEPVPDATADIRPAPAPGPDDRRLCGGAG
jgi:hypothetical protein